MKQKKLIKTQIEESIILTSHTLNQLEHYTMQIIEM